MLTLIHATGGCTTTLSESALKVHSGRTISCRTGELNPSQYWAGLFGRSLNPLSYLIPSLHYFGFYIIRLLHVSQDVS